MRNVANTTFLSINMKKGDYLRDIVFGFRIILTWKLGNLEFADIE
jgi:hypothetical protein